ncbi:MAG: hypothetical protein ACU837_00075 [Gammaproteobacteria bacterium]
MKLFWLVFFTGLILFYFVKQALKIEFGSVEILLHTLYHFFSGFIVLAGWCFFKFKKRFKVFFAIVITILLIDELGDYFRGVEDMTSIMLAYNLYMLLWGAAAGIAFINYWRHRRLHE